MATIIMDNKFLCRKNALVEVNFFHFRETKLHQLEKGRRGSNLTDTRTAFAFAVLLLVASKKPTSFNFIFEGC